MRKTVLAGAICIAAACGGSSGTPTGPTPNPPALAATVLSVVRLEGASAVSGATVQTLGGTSRSAVTDGSGHATFDPGLPAGTEISITAGGFLTRQELSNRFNGTFSIAPNRPGGFDPPFLDELVYQGNSSTPGANVTNRIASPVAIVLPAEWQNDPVVLATFQGAASDVTNANGKFAFTVETAPSSDKLRVDIVIKPELSAAGQAVYSVSLGTGIISQASIEMRDRSAAVIRNLVAHEMIHILGLGHISGRTSIMAPVVSTGIQADDALAMRFLVERNPLNRFEDDGRTAVPATAAPGMTVQRVFTCAR